MKNIPEQLEGRMIADQLAHQLKDAVIEYTEMEEAEDSPKGQRIKAETFNIIAQILELDPEHPILRSIDFDEFFKDWANHLTSELHAKK